LHDGLMACLFLPVKPLTLMKMYLNEIHRNIWIGRQFWYGPIQKGVTYWDDWSPLPLSFDVGYVIREVLAKQGGLKLSGTYQLLVCDEDDYILGKDFDSYTVHY
jgi:hypothetical protein